MRQKNVLDAADARRALDAALANAAAQGFAMSVALVDDAGFALALTRMDGAGLMTAQVALDKARTAALLRAPSAVLAERIKTDPALMRLDYLPLAGGAPLIVDGQCCGAIGVSGGTAGQDEAVAAAGLEAIQAPSA